ncbi:uncharacterized protein LOC122391992 isoform X2 [Amphibalanus amphitrite]|uniref:uncharacterized protein LOC122391992 isoform X2 n=1 Tax=Amphibalanus amphitrite TaxID=1232801 RepID=UPI001C91B8E0|nr:uncharacterized protein LOC122391992 isoform X2 [Amphibalanus amphitrite]
MSDNGASFFVGQLLLDEGVPYFPGTERNGSRRRNHVCYVGNGRGKKRTSSIPGKSRKSSKRTSVARPISSVQDAGTSQAVEASAVMQDLYLAASAERMDDNSNGRTWKERQDVENENWGHFRTSAFESFVGSYAVPNDASVLPLHGSRHACAHCQMEMVIESSESAVIVISALGRFDLRLPAWRCPGCNHRIEASSEDLMLCGYFVASPVQMSTVVHEDVFVMWKELRFRTPGTSLRAFLRMLEKLGTTYGSEAPIDLQRFEKAYSEWANMEFELQRLMDADLMSCEACGPEPACVHVDGNFKLYRYRSSGDSSMSSAYHTGTFLHDGDAVKNHAAKLAPISKTTNRCGTSLWAAARNNPGLPSSKRTQDETGLVAATCRHSVVLGGVNMYRGEQFAYGHYLHQTLFKNACFFASDVVCKYWPWAQRVARVFPEYSLGDTQPFLSVMHASGHAYYCQIRYGGFWQPGSGWSVMETTEIANAFLSRAANTTKYMTSAQRVDSLTDLVLSYNSDKHDHMPELLLAKMAAATRRVSELAEEQQALLDKHGLAVEDVGELVEELKLLAVSLSTRDLRSDGSDLRNAIELVSDSLRVRQASVSRVASTPKQRAKLRRLVVADKKKLNKLLSRYQQTTGVLIDADACADGHFPWHEEYSAVGPLSLSEKRALCDVYMKRRRAQEERDIVKQEMERLLTYGSYVMDVLVQKLEWIDHQLSVPAAERLPFVDFEDDSRENKYKVQRQTENVLRGLQGILHMAFELRRRYGVSAHRLLSEYIETTS